MRCFNFCALLIVLLAVPNTNWAQRKPEVAVLNICNKGSVTVLVARAADVGIWAADRQISGWFSFPPGKCLNNLAFRGFQGSHWFFVGYRAKDGEIGPIRIENGSIPYYMKQSDRKFIVATQYNEFKVGLDVKLRDIPPNHKEGEWRHVVFPLYINMDKGRQIMTLRPNNRDIFCPIDQDSCYRIRDYESLAKRSEKSTQSLSTKSSNEPATRTDNTRKPSPSAEEIRKKKIESEYRAKRSEQFKRCKEAGWCDVWEDPYMVRPYGGSNWYDINGREVSESKWPDLPVRSGVLQKNVSWISKLNSELGSTSCGRTVHIEAPVYYDAAKDNLEYLKYQQGSLLLSDKYDSFGVALKSVYLESTSRKSGKCWELVLRCAELDCVKQRSAISTAKDGPKAFRINAKNVDVLRLKFATETSAEAASQALSEVVSGVPLQFQARRFAHSLIVGALIATVALAIPLMLAGLIAPRFFYPFAKPSRWKWLMFTVLYLLCSIGILILSSATIGGRTKPAHGSGINLGLVIGLIIVMAPTVIGRVKKSRSTSKSPVQSGDVEL